MFLLSNAFLNFLQEYLTYIVLGVSALVLLIIIIIIAITVKKSKKPLTYVSDEIDRTVDQAAKQKAEQIAQTGTGGQAESIATKSVAHFATQSEAAPCPQNDCAAPEQVEQVELDEQEHPQMDVPTTAAEAAPEEVKQVEPEQPQADVPTAAAEAAPEEVEQVESDEQEQPNGQPEQTDEELVQTDENQPNGDAVLQQKSRPVSYRVVYDNETRMWEVRKDNAKRVIRRVHTKKEALQIAHELSQNQELNLVVHKKDGKFQKRR